MRFMKRFCIAVAGLALVCFVETADLRGENWPGWRGPRGDGTSLEQGIPVRWSGTENVAWKVAVPHQGHASPIVWGDRIFLVGTDLEKQERILTALDRTDGATLWERSVVRAPLERKHPGHRW